MQLDKKQQTEICYYILAYLSDNPDAGDTFDGIVQWWVLEQQIKFETRKVSKAVARLISEELIVEIEEPDSGVIYRLNRSKEAAIQEILKKIEAAR